MKRMHEHITQLKSKSRIGFVWNDDKGMDVMPERQAEWDDLVRVRFLLSCQSTMSDQS